MGPSSDQLDLMYDCDNNLRKADNIAKTLVSSWVQMSKIAAINGHKFLAILQPNAYIEKPTTSQIGLETPYSQELKKQFEIIYPMIKKYAANRKINFVDMTHI